MNVTLRSASTQLNKKYGTMRRYAVRYATADPPFPKPKVTAEDGRGILWDFDEIAKWWEHHEANLQKGGGHHHKDPSASSSLGHVFRKLREANTCTNPSCQRKFKGGEYVYELRDGDTLNIYCEECYESIRDGSDTDRQTQTA